MIRRWRIIGTAEAARLAITAGAAWPGWATLAAEIGYAGSACHTGISRHIGVSPAASSRAPVGPVGRSVGSRRRWWGFPHHGSAGRLHVADRRSVTIGDMHTHRITPPPAGTGELLVDAHDLTRMWGKGDAAQVGIAGVDLQIDRGELVRDRRPVRVG